MLLSHVLRPPQCPSQPTAICRLSPWPQLPQSPLSQLDLELSMCLSGPQSPGLAGGCQQCTLGASPFAISLRGCPVPSCAGVAVLCPRKLCWFNLCFPAAARLSLSLLPAHTSGHTCVHACAPPCGSCWTQAGKPMD